MRGSRRSKRKFKFKRYTLAEFLENLKAASLAILIIIIIIFLLNISGCFEQRQYDEYLIYP